MRISVIDFLTVLCTFIATSLLVQLHSCEAQISLVDETKESSPHMKFPLMRVFVGGYGVAGLFPGYVLVTNLENLGSKKYIAEFKARPTVLFTYGIMDSPALTIGEDGFNNSPAVLIYAGLLLRGFFGDGKPINFVCVEWNKYAKDDLISVISRFQPIANEIGDQLYNMAFNSSDPIDLSTWHMIGFSVGGHIPGLIGRRIKERTNGRFTMPRITALDPLGPLLNYPVTSIFFPHIEKTDATYIDVIHTNANGIGSGWKVGHIDFWPNYGENQPGCPKGSALDLAFHSQNVCSHSRALFLYAYTVKLVGKAFPAVKCTKNLLHQLECTNDIAYMVFDSNARSAPEGDYYLMTDSAGLTVDQFTWSNTNPFDLKEKGYLPFLNKMSTHGDGTNSFLD